MSTSLETAIEKPPDQGQGPLISGHRVVHAVIMAAVAMAVIDGIVVSIALPTITRTFSADVAQSQWIFTAYLVTETSLLLIFGRVSELVGKRRLFLSGLILFTTSSLACGLSVSLWDLIAFRVLQACGSAMIFSICIAILYETSPPMEQGSRMGYVSTTMGAAAVVAPILGGFITGSLGWEFIFLINVPIGTACIILFSLYSSPETYVPRSRPMDWPGAVTLASFLVFLIIALANVSTTLSISVMALIFIALSLVSLLSFILVERRCTHPLFDTSLFWNLDYTLPNSAMVCVYMAFFMLYLVGPFYFEDVMALDPVSVGVVFLVLPLTIIVASPLAGMIYDRWKVGVLASAGILLTSFSLFLLGIAVVWQDLSAIIIIFLPLSLGISLFFAPNATEVMRALPLEKASLASSMSATLKNLGMIMGVSLSALILSGELARGGLIGHPGEAGAAFIALAIQKVLFTGSFLCGIGGVLSLAKDIRKRGVGRGPGH
ncbi:MAG: MFS transporter [Methanolinea sp.]|nr:MFS transporter [Methanolinea sp.]